MKSFAIYLRVSTQRQGFSGLGIEAQRKMCIDYITSQKGEIIKEFSDIESGKNRSRKGLLSAIDFCKETGCILVIAKLDRLARDVEFTFRVINTGIDIYFCDMPNVNTLILGVMSSVAQYERELISQRTKSALNVKKDKGEQIGGTSELWGKNTGANRINSMNLMRDKSAKDRKEKAQKNINNARFWTFMQKWIDDKGEPKNIKEWSFISEELRAYNFLTSSGMEFNSVRAAAMYRNLKNIMNKKED